jgi:hypothetical protein
LAEYADAVVEAIGDRGNLVLAAQSFGGFTVPLVCKRVAADLMVLAAGMIPTPAKHTTTIGRTRIGSLRTSITWSSQRR